jgi:hypothetical protein
LRIGLVTEVVERTALWTWAHEMAALLRPNPPRRFKEPCALFGSRWTDPTGRPWSRSSSTHGWAVLSGWWKCPAAGPSDILRGFADGGGTSPKTSLEGPRAFLEKRDPEWQCK